MPNMTVNVSLKDTDKFQEILSVVKEFITDERVPEEVKQEFKTRILSIADSSKS